MIKKHTEHIISLVKAGDISVLANIYKENRTGFLIFAKKYNLPDEDLIDIYQDAIIALRDNIVMGKVVNLESSIKTYLFSVGKYMIYKKIKEHHTNKTFQEDIYSVYNHIDYFEYHKDIDNRNQQLVTNCFVKLGEKCQQILKLFYYDGLTLKEIQDYLNYDNYNVIKSQKSRCLRTLKEIIDKQPQNE